MSSTVIASQCDRRVRLPAFHLWPAIFLLGLETIFFAVRR